MDAFPRPNSNLEDFPAPEIPESLLSEAWSKITNEPNKDSRDVLVFRWLSQLTADLDTTSESIIKQEHFRLEEQLSAFLTPNSAPVTPKKAIRQLICNSFLILIARGESRRAFDLLVTVQNYLKGIAKPTKEEKDAFPTPTIILHVLILGKFSERFGPQYLSIFSESLYLLFKILKGATDPSLRFSCIEAITQSIQGCSRALNEAQVKDTVKVLKTLLTDKAMQVRRAASECLSALARENCLGLQNSPDFETYMAYLIKGFEGADYEARIGIARSIARVLATSQSIMVVVPLQPLKTPVKKKKPDGKENDADMKTTEKSLLTCSEMLLHLSTPLLKNSLPRESRVGLAEAYAFLFQILDHAYIGTHYSDFLTHFTNDVLSNPKLGSFSIPEVVCIKSLVASLLRRLGELSNEAQQLLTVKLIIEKYVALWSSDQNPTGAVLNEWVLQVLLAELAQLIANLSGVSSSLQELYLDPILKIAAHPSNLVQTSVASCMMNIVLHSPSLFISFFSSIFNVLSKEVPYIASNVTLDLCRKYIGFSLAIASLLHISQHIPLYVPAGTYLQVFSLASTLLKTNLKEVKDMGDAKKIICVREVAWNLITGLMTAGASPVKLHLNQCLLLWKNAFPKTLPSQTAEKHALLHEKEAALRSVIALLIYNPGATNDDVKKRLSAIVSNVIRLMLAYPNSTSSSTPPHTHLILPFNWNSTDLEHLFKKRLFECICLLPITHFEEFYPQLMNRATEVYAQDFTDSKKLDLGVFSQLYHGLEKQTQPVNSMFGPVFWHGAEYGATTLPTHYQTLESVWKYDSFRVPESKCLLDYEQWLSMESLLFHPAQGALEYDVLSIFQFPLAVPHPRWLLPSPPAYGLINAAMLLGASLLTAFVSSIQEAYLETMIRVARQKSEKPGRKVTFLANLLYMLHMATSNTLVFAQSKSYPLTKQSTKIIFELAQMGMALQDAGIRYICANLVGKIAELSGPSMFSFIAQSLVTQIVEKADSPELRSGGALGLSMLHCYTRSSISIKSTVNILQGLSNDAHSMVSQWSIVALTLLFEQRGGDVVGFVDTALNAAFKQMLQESRPLFVGSLLYGCVEALGPELQVADQQREWICQMTDYFISSCGFEESAEAWYTVSHVMLMVPKAFPVVKFASLLQVLLSSPHTSLREAALTCLCQMIQRYPDQVLMATENLEQTLLGLVQEFPDLVRKCIASLVEATHSPSRWVDLCRQFLTPSVQNQGTQLQVSGAATDTEDDSEGLAFSSSHLPKTDKQLHTKWFSQLAALEALRQVIAHLAKLGLQSHFHFQNEKTKQAKRDWLVYRVGDLIRVAFTASTSLTQKVRSEGLCLLEDVLDHFSSTKDPDYEGHMLLEQYQAQFSSALTPAFHPDAHPEILAKACRVCARYIGSGITEELFTLNRIIKLLVQALEVSQKPLPSLSEHAQIMVSVAVYGAWADLQNMCKMNAPLADIVKPQLPQLIPLWLTCLFEYSVIKLEPEECNMSQSQLESISGNLIYATGNRQNVLEIYKNAWISILAAVTSSFSQESIELHLQRFGTMSGEQGETYRLIMILLGLAFEPLVSVGTTAQSVQICLDALRAILVPRFVPSLPPTFLMEVVYMADRLLQTEFISNKLKVTQLLSSLISSYQPNIPEPVTAELIRVMVATIARTLPEILEDPSTAEIFLNKSKDGAALAIEALRIIANVSIFHRTWIPLTFHLFSVAFQSELFAHQMTPLSMLLKSIFEGEVETNLSCSFATSLLNVVESNMKSNPELAKPSLVTSTLVASIISLPSLIPRLSSILLECIYIPQLSMTAFQCIRSIVSKRTEPREFASLFVAAILPSLLIFVLTDHSLPMQECVHILGIVGCMEEYTETILSGLVGILVKFPTFLQLKPIIASQLLIIAKQHVQVFREFIQKLAVNSRQSLESCLRAQQHAHTVSSFPTSLHVS